MSMRLHQSEEKELKRYIEGWLECKREKKFKRLWCVLKGQVNVLNEICKAFLFCFKDSNTHVREHFIGSYNVEFNTKNPVTLHSAKLEKHKKYEFEIIFGGQKVQFLADDEITRERWVYALVDLVGNRVHPSELPHLQNSIRSYALACFLSGLQKRSKFSNRSLTEYAPELSPDQQRLRNNTFDTSKSIDLGHSLDSMLGKNVFSRKPSTPRSPSLLPVRWYHKALSREEAVSKLKIQSVGTYLIRDCSTEFGSFTLSFKDMDKIKHHKIKPVGTQFQFEDSEITLFFPTPQEAVLFYMESKRKGSFLPTPLNNRTRSDVGVENDIHGGFEGSYVVPQRRVSASMTKVGNQYHVPPERIVSPKDLMKAKAYTFDTSSETARQPQLANPIVQGKLSKQTSVGGLSGRPVPPPPPLPFPSYDNGRPADGPVPLSDQYLIMNPSVETCNGSAQIASAENIDDAGYLTGVEVQSALKESEDQTYLEAEDIDVSHNPSSSPAYQYNPPSSPTYGDPIPRKHSYVNDFLPDLPEQQSDDSYLTDVNCDEIDKDPSGNYQLLTPDKVDMKGHKENDEDELYLNQAVIEMNITLNKRVTETPPPLPPRTYNPERLYR